MLNISINNIWVTSHKITYQSWISNKVCEAKTRLFDRSKITKQRSAEDRSKILLALSSLCRDLKFTRRRARSIFSVAQRSNEPVRLSSMEQITINITRRGIAIEVSQILLTRFFSTTTTMTTITSVTTPVNYRYEPQKNWSIRAQNEMRFHRLHASTIFSSPASIWKVSDTLSYLFVFSA